MQNLMREGEKKTFKKKTIEPIFGKVNEGDEIKKTFDLFKKKLMRATKKTSKKKHSWIFFFSRNKLVFFRNVFLSPEIDCFFGNRQQCKARAGQKKNICFFFL